MDKKEEARDIVEQSPAMAADDNFAGFVDSYAGDEETTSPRMIQGTLIKLTNDARWVNGEGVELDPQLRLIVVNMRRVVQKWIDQMPAETIEVAPGQPFPDLRRMNDACPQSEWREDLNGKLVGPWQIQRLLYLLDPLTLDKYTFPTSTIGGSIALHALADKIAWMQKYRQPGVRPLVHLSTTPMRTRYGTRMRPHFVILDWIAPGGDGGGNLAHKPSPQLAGPTGGDAADAPTPSKKVLAAAGLQTVGEPSLAEETGDEIPF